MSGKIKLKYGEKSRAAKYLKKSPQWFNIHKNKFDDCILPDGTYDLPALKKSSNKINRKYQQNREKQHTPKPETPPVENPNTEDEVKSYLDETIGELSLLDLNQLQKRNELEKLLMARIKRNEVESAIIPVESAKKTIELILSTTINQLESLSVKTRPLLAVEPDSFECGKILDKEIDFIRRQIITDLKKFQEGDYVR